MQKTKEKETGTQAIERALKVLRCFLGENRKISLTEIAKKVGIPISTASRILNILEKENFVRREEASKKYALGQSIYLLGYCEKMQDTLRKVAYPYLVKLRDEFQETSIMYVRDGTVRRLYEKVEPEANFRFTPVVGTEYYLWAGAGAKSLLAFMRQEEIDAILSEARPLTPKTIVDREAMYGDILSVRRRGYAVSLDEYNHGFTSISAPVVNRKDESLCALSVTGPSVRFSPELIDVIGERLRGYCLELSRNFGWPGPFEGEAWTFPFLGPDGVAFVPAADRFPLPLP